MISPNHLLELLGCFTRADVRFIVAGGVAAVLHGVERMTLDVDIAIEETPENIQRFLAVTAQLGMAPKVPVPPEILLDRKSLDRLVKEKGALVLAFSSAEMPWLQIDVFLERESSFETLRNHSLSITLEDGISLWVVTTQHLIEMKRRVTPPRAKDIEDISALEKIIADESP